MNQDLHYLQKPFITVGAIFDESVTINDILNESTSTEYEHKGFCYTFKAEINSDFKVGDYAVVHARNELKIVKIVQVHHTPKIDINADFEYKWVIQKIDFNNFKNRHNEQERIEKLLTELEIAERREKLAERLDAMSKKDSGFADILNSVLKDKVIDIFKIK